MYVAFAIHYCFWPQTRVVPDTLLQRLWTYVDDIPKPYVWSSTRFTVSYFFLLFFMLSNYRIYVARQISWSLGLCCIVSRVRIITFKSHDWQRGFRTDIKCEMPSQFSCSSWERINRLWMNKEWKTTRRLLYCIEGWREEDPQTVYIEACREKLIS